MEEEKDLFLLKAVSWWWKKIKGDTNKGKDIQHWLEGAWFWVTAIHSEGPESFKKNRNRKSKPWGFHGNTHTQIINSYSKYEQKEKAAHYWFPTTLQSHSNTVRWKFAKAKLRHTDRRDRVQAIFSRGAGHTRQETSTLLKKLSWANRTSICVGKPQENGCLRYKAEAAKPLSKKQEKRTNWTTVGIWPQNHRQYKQKETNGIISN